MAGRVLQWCAALFLTCGVQCKFPDWLVTQITTPTTLTETPQGTIILSNGLISREFTIRPDFATVDFYSHEKQSSLLRALDTEAVIGLDFVTYRVGGLKTSINRAYLNRTALKSDIHQDPDAFQYQSHSTHVPEAPFPYTPMRGAPKSIVWPPKGLRLDVKFAAPFWAPELHRQVVVTVHYEMYDGIPLIAKWLTVDALTTESKQVVVDVYSVEYLAVNQQWGSIGESYGWLYVVANQPHSTLVTWRKDTSQALNPGAFMPVLNCSYESTPTVPLEDEGFETYKVLELVHGSHDAERIALAKHRMMNLLAPQSRETPIFFHLTDTSPAAVKLIVDQMAEVGFEMLIFSFGSGFNVESSDEKYINEVAELVAYANSKNIEVGGYDLIALQRNPASISKEYNAVNPDGSLQGNACMASKWYDYIMEHFSSFMAKTNMTMAETDGPYGGYPCAATNHPHHRDIKDSIYQQNRLQSKFYSFLRKKNVFVNQPDFYFYQGGSKTGLGYVEQQFGLPRWQDLSVSRQDVFDDTYYITVTMAWMAVPLVDSKGGGAAAMFEPLKDHLVEYEWAFATYMGSGIASCYRGPRLYDTDETKALVMKWVSFYKKYREILSSDIIHIRRADMQSIDCFMHVNPSLKVRGLVMVFNPTNEQQTMNITLPLYYTGITTVALVSEMEGELQQYSLARDYSIQIAVDMKPLNITWFLVM